MSISPSSKELRDLQLVEKQKKLKAREWSKKYYLKNREKILEKKRRFPQNRTYCKQYYMKNRDRIRKYKRERYAEKDKIYSRNYYLKNREQILEKRRRSRMLKKSVVVATVVEPPNKLSIHYIVN